MSINFSGILYFDKFGLMNFSSTSFIYSKKKNFTLWFWFTNLLHLNQSTSSGSISSYWFSYSSSSLSDCYSYYSSFSSYSSSSCFYFYLSSSSDVFIYLIYSLAIFYTFLYFLPTIYYFLSCGCGFYYWDFLFLMDLIIEIIIININKIANPIITITNILNHFCYRRFSNKLIFSSIFSSIFSF